jgi:hypothetical protein
MAKHEIEPFVWQHNLNQLSVELEEKIAYVEVNGAHFGDELENFEMQLMKISYDDNNDILEIMFDQLNHLIESPLMICFELHQNILEKVEILDDNDNKNTIIFSDTFSLTNRE